jgi:spermidine/putrescine transport system substrate-binding protein
MARPGQRGDGIDAPRDREEPAHRRLPIPRMSRRSFLGRTAVMSLAAAGMGELLTACGDQLYTSGNVIIPSPDNPVKWPLSKKYPIIDSGQKIKAGSTLKLYNYPDYIGPGVVKAFEQLYDVDVTISTFNDTDEALTKMASGAVSYDIYFPSYDQIGTMVAADLLRPINHDYVPNAKNLWPQFQNPWYDRHWRYSVPYTTYTTGIGWRTDLVSEDIAALDNPYDVLWDPQYKSRLAIIDDFHTAMSMVLLRDGVTDINTGNKADLDQLRDSLIELNSLTKPRVTITMYNDLAVGQYGLAQMWSGDIVNAQYYMPKGESPDVFRYWFPPDGKGMVDNDLMVILGGGENPVAAHHFLNYMLDADVAAKNFFYTGYQPPQNSISPQRVVDDGYAPPNLETAAVLPKYFSVGYRLLGLEPTENAQWHEIWQEFKANG